jgi:hypothetical protein
MGMPKLPLSYSICGMCMVGKEHKAKRLKQCIIHVTKRNSVFPWYNVHNLCQNLKYI